MVMKSTLGWALQPQIELVKKQAMGMSIRFTGPFYDLWFYSITALKCSFQESTRDMPVNIRQTITAALKQVSQAFMVDS